MQQAGEWSSWWLGLLLGCVPLALLAAWHCTDAFYRVAFALRYRGRRGHGHGHRLPPGHMGVPFLGETLALLWYFKVARRPDGFLQAMKRRHGDGCGEIYRTHLFGSPTVVVCSPAANKFVLQSSDGSFAARRPAQDLLGLSSMFNAEGGHHARIRSFVIAAVNRPSALRTFARVVQPRVAAALRSWVDKGTITAATEIRKVMFENICMMFISTEPSAATEKMDVWFSGILAGLRTLPFDFPGTPLNHARKCRRNVTVMFREELMMRRKTCEEGEEKVVVEDDVMSGLMRMEDDDGKKLSDDEVVDNIVTLVIGAYESTANAITWATYHLAKSPDALAKLREENVVIAKDMNGDLITTDDISKMKYTAKVVEEALRMANIASMLFRVAHRDVQYGGYTIPQGWQVVVWLRSLHTDPKYYKDPLTFNPDRWDKPAKPGTYQVFGGGYRVCAGNMLARLQITIMLHHLSVGYEWELLNPDAAIDYLPHPKPVDDVVMAFRKLSTSS